MYTRKDFSILKTFMARTDSRKGLIKGDGLSVKELMAATNCSEGKVRGTIKKFIEDKYIEIGISDGRTRRYFITDLGINELMDAYNMKEE